MPACRLPPTRFPGKAGKREWDAVFLRVNGELSSTKITGSGLRRLKDDSGLERFSDLKQLRALWLIGSTCVTNAGIAKLKAAIPKLGVYRNVPAP